MVRHQVFFESLGALDASDPGWSSPFAGLSVLRIVDSLAAAADAPNAAHRAAINAARATASSIREGDPSRAILLRIFDLLEKPNGLTGALARELLAYGRSLDLEGRWPLAADVFGTVAEKFRSRRNRAIVIESLTALGAAARNTGDWETSERSYAEAQHMADSAGDRARSLTAQVGIANSHVAHGNLPAANAELEEVFAEAGTAGLQQVEAIALHTRAYLAIASGDYQNAVHYGYRSLELTIDETARDRILGDIAAAYAGLGLRETARDGFLIVAVTSPHQWVRWQATLNLMELAIEDGAERLFDDYYAQVQSEPLDPRLRAFLLLLKARGFRTFGRAGSEALFAAAHEEATRHRLHQIAFEVEAEAKRERQPVNVPGRATVAEFEVYPGELDRIAEVLMHLRKEVVAG